MEWEELATGPEAETLLAIQKEFGPPSGGLSVLDRLRRLLARTSSPSRPAALTLPPAVDGGRASRTLASSTPRSRRQPAVRRKAGHFGRNNPWIANGVAAIVTGTIGAGIKPQPQHPDPRADA